MYKARGCLWILEIYEAANELGSLPVGLADGEIRGAEEVGPSATGPGYLRKYMCKFYIISTSR